MIGEAELKLVTQHRPLAEIAKAEKIRAFRALEVRAKTVKDGYNAQLKAMAADLDKLSDEYNAASIAAEGSR